MKEGGEVLEHRVPLVSMCVKKKESSLRIEKYPCMGEYELMLTRTRIDTLVESNEMENQKTMQSQVMKRRNVVPRIGIVFV